MISGSATEVTLMAFWSRNKSSCRPVGQIVGEARAGTLPGVEPLESGLGYRVTNEAAALAAMHKRIADAARLRWQIAKQLQAHG